MADTRQYALIVGSGLADFGAEAGVEHVTTRYGRPSAPLRRVSIGRHTVIVLPRHGDNHEIAPHRINYRANLMALRMLDVDAVLSVNTVGFIPDSFTAGGLAVPSQLIDYTWGRAHTIHDGSGPELDHVDFTAPFSQGLRRALLDAAETAGQPCHDGGVYGVTQGPRLETAAEIDRYQRDGVDFVGMTAMPEVALARELGMDCACLSMLVNPAAGRSERGIHADIQASMQAARQAVTGVIEAFFRESRL